VLKQLSGQEINYMKKVIKHLGINNIFRSLRHRNYFLFFSGQGISLIGTWMQRIAMSWLVYRLTGSALLLGVVGFTNSIPTFIFAPIAGVFADRWNRLRTVIITQILAMLQAFILAFLVLSDKIQIWHIIVLGVALGIINAFDIPVRQAFVIDMVEKKEDLGNAIALNSALVNGARLLGPSIAGLLISLVGEGMCFLLNALSYIAVILALLAMKITIQKKSDTDKNLWGELREGFRYAVESKPILAILLLLSLVSLAGVPYTVLMPVFATDILHGGPHTLGFLMSASGIGALIGTFFLASRTDSAGLGRWVVLAAAIFGLGLIMFSFTTIFWLSAFILIVAGFGMMVQTAVSNTLLQFIVDDSKRGRVMSFYTMAFMGMAPFGSLIAGSLAHTAGTANTIFAGGVCCIIGAVLFALKVHLPVGGE
jgi:MFS family permease